VKRFYIVCATILVVAGAGAYAQEVSVPHTFSAGGTISASEMNENFDELETAINANSAALVGVVPVGAVIAWLGDLTGVPALPDNYVTCSGQTISDPESPLDGVTLPDLNGDQRFLRGADTSGADGGTESHTHNASVESVDTGFDQWVPSSTSFAEHLPPYYEVIWIIRIK
jgi:hypothetical protein